MKQKYTEYKQLDLPKIGKEVRKFWEENNVFEKSVETREGKPQFVFYEGPPSANGMPGIHHVMARAIKDIFCRYKTLKGFQVKRKAGWDTHGLPIEIAVEKTLEIIKVEHERTIEITKIAYENIIGITKEDIGKSISVIDYNKACRREVMKYKDKWDDITKQMGYWVDLNNPYITFDNKYIETVWYLLNQLYQKGLLYKGYSIQPYSPAAGTGLSSHELNLPGCYKDVKDTTAVAQFKVVKNEKSEFLFSDIHGDLFFLAWTTTPWTLPSNTALAVGANISYIAVKTFNQYTLLPITVILAKDLFSNFFPEKNAELKLDEYNPGQKVIPYEVIAEYKGLQLEGIRFEQLLPYAQPETGDPFRVVVGDFVTTEGGTGIVHIAPSFGADDFRMNRIYNTGALTMVDRQGKFIEAMGEFAGRYVKQEYDANFNPANDQSVDVDIVVKLKKENKCFKTEKYEHSYPHCWRTDKPILYYPIDSWFIKTTAFKERLLELNKTINWKPESTGTGRFGNWLENLVDWNLSRSRFWGVPIPIWTSEDRSEQLSIGSVVELKKEIKKSLAAGFMKENPLASFISNDNSEENYLRFDIHRPYVDEIILVSPSGKKMFRELDLIDVWFDSGAMPYAQFHYPFENKKNLKEYFPADFIAEGVDQTRGWFFTLHVIATMLFDSVAFKNVISNGLVLDKKGNKMSKKEGNTVNPFETIEKYGPDATRWYMITNSQPWDNLKFDLEGVAEVQRKFFGTLYNTYTFFAIYANIDNFSYDEAEIPIERKPEIDRWIISQLNSLIKTVDESYNDYEPTKAGRAIQDFVDEHLSNWYVRLCRRRFWKGEYTEDKISAYQTLYRCLEVLAQMISPIAPFFAERLFLDLNIVSGRIKAGSVHLTDFPVADEKLINKELEERMQIAQSISSMVLSLRKKVNIRVRQPLGKIMVPALDVHLQKQVEAVKNLILSEVNVKELEFITDASGIIVKKIKPNFKTLGPRFGKKMKQIAAIIAGFSQADISKIEKDGIFIIDVEGVRAEILLADVEILSEDIPGWLVTNTGSLAVALDITVTDTLRDEGIARELINRIQNLRKESLFDVTDKIKLQVEKHEKINSSIENNISYICAETLAVSLELVEQIKSPGFHNVELVDDITARVFLNKV